MLVMERSFAVLGSYGGGTGNYVVLYEASAGGATDVLGVDALYDGGSPIAFTPMSKSELFVFENLVGLELDKIDNIEGMTFGPDLPDGRKTLVVVSDDNFNDFGERSHSSSFSLLTSNPPVSRVFVCAGVPAVGGAPPAELLEWRANPAEDDGDRHREG